MFDLLNGLWDLGSARSLAVPSGPSVGTVSPMEKDSGLMRMDVGDPMLWVYMFGILVVVYVAGRILRR